jgi:eukaryotic-like serine/threonine-protein kinase
MHGNGPFVGREAELQILRGALDDAAAGYGSVVTIAGEAGIGKSRLVEEFARQARAANAPVLRGHCYEDDWAPPYSPFVEAIEAYVREHVEEIGSAERIEISRIVPGMAAAVPGEEPPRRSEERKYRLYQAVTRMLQDAAASTPLCLVLEDLHDADAGTLELLTHLGRNLQSTRLLFVVTYRSNEVSPAHELSKTLAELDRRLPTRSMVVAGLSLQEATELVAAEASATVPGAIAQEVWNRTGGHPLFLRELARDLATAGVGTPGPLRGLPASLQQLIGVRLAKLSNECRQLLELTSVFGHEASLGTLRAASSVENGTLNDALAEAVAAGLLDERESTGGATYSFHHMLFREVLYLGLPAAHRDELHVQVGRALEEAFENVPGHAAELAEHLAHSFDRGDVRRAAGYAELAAKRAASVFAWADAVAWYERGLHLLDRSDPGDGERRCNLLLALARMLFNSGELPRLEDEVAEEAFHLAVDLGDSVRAADATMLAIRSMVQRSLYTALLGTARGPLRNPRRGGPSAGPLLCRREPGAMGRPPSHPRRRPPRQRSQPLPLRRSTRDERLTGTGHSRAVHREGDTSPSRR